MSLASGDLTTFPTAKAYVEPLPSDAILTGLISRVSMMIRGYINRPILVPRSYTEVYNGTGTNALVLYNFPVIGAALTSLVVSGATIGVAPQPTNDNSANSIPPLTGPFGYRIAPWNYVPPGQNTVIELVGGYFPNGNQNIIVTYNAGYEVVNEAATIPTDPGPYTVLPATPWGTWATDQGVTLSDGTALVPTTSNTPATGQYYPPDPTLATPRLFYTFNAAQAGLGVLLSYGYIPADLEQVALEVIAERSSYRRRAGVRSQTLANQESITYDNNPSGLSGWAKTALQAYCNVVPPPIGANV
jgi:hypothetical protein